MSDLFNHINAIYTNQSKDYFKSLDEGAKKTYSAYMVNRFLSMNLDQIELVNEAQRYNITDPNIHYLFFSQILPKKKQFNKYVKAEKQKEYPEWIVDILVKHYYISTDEASYYLDTYYGSDTGKDALRALLALYGETDTKKLRKADL